MRRFTTIANYAFWLLLVAALVWRLWIGPGWVLTMLVYGCAATSIMAMVAMYWMATIQSMEKAAIDRRERRRIRNQRETARE